jgi:hypothetical protein
VNAQPSGDVTPETSSGDVTPAFDPVTPAFDPVTPAFDTASLLGMETSAPDRPLGVDSEWS